MFRAKLSLREMLMAPSKFCFSVGAKVEGFAVVQGKIGAMNSARKEWSRYYHGAQLPGCEALHARFIEHQSQVTEKPGLAQVVRFGGDENEAVKVGVFPRAQLMFTFPKVARPYASPPYTPRGALYCDSRRQSRFAVPSVRRGHARR